MAQAALLLGNGPNQIRSTTYSWPNVVGALANLCGRPDLARPTSTKPFPLVFEEMVLCSPEPGAREEELKGEVSRLVRRIVPNTVHRRARTLPIKHLITTNYDYALEDASGIGSEADDLGRETRYSLFRRRRSGAQFVWHAHGEADKPGTITLGHDQYVGYLARIKNYLTPDAKRSGNTEHRSPFVNGIVEFERSGLPYSWIDLFLRNDIHIVGFGLDYSEIGLWWLITYKARLRAQHPRTPKGIAVGRTSYYFFHPNRITGRDKGKLAMLQSMGVETSTINAGADYSDATAAYNQALAVVELAT